MQISLPSAFLHALAVVRVREGLMPVDVMQA